MRNIKQNLTSMVFHLLTFAITLALIVGIDIWHFEFDWSQITLDYLYVRVLISMGYVMIKISISNFVYDLREVADISYTELIDNLEKSSKKHRGYDFNDKINRLDYQTKVDTWLRLKEKQLFKHERRVSAKVIRDMNTNKEENYSRRTKRFIRKRNRILEQMSEEWIYKHLNTETFPYPEILPQEILYGTIEFQPKKSYLDRAPLKRIILRSLPIALLSLSATIVLGALASIETEGGIGLFVSLMSILVVLTANISIGIVNGIRGHRSRCMNANKRSEIMVNYVEGVYNSLPEVPKRIPDAIKKAQITELSNTSIG